MKFKSFWLVSICLLTLLCFSSSLVAYSFDWSAENRIPIRGANIKTCQVLLAPLDGEEINDSVGIPISSSIKTEDLRIALNTIVEERGKVALDGAHLYVTGVEMGNETEVKKQFTDTLRTLDLESSKIEIRVLSIPKKLAKVRIREAFRQIYDRLVYFFPSMARDYETPTRDEIVSGLISTALIEAPNVIYLHQALPNPDFALTLTAHTLILLTMNVYQKFMYNWLLRSHSSVELFVRQVALSFPFVANYNVFGNFSKIEEFTQTHSWVETRARFPHEIASFGASQGLTMFLQTLFYQIVMTRGVRGWVDKRVGAENYNDARAWANYLSSPILMLDATLLTMASATGRPLVSMGPMQVNTGHLALLGLTAVGSTLWVWPQILDPTLKWYQASKRFFQKQTGEISEGDE